MIGAIRVRAALVVPNGNTPLGHALSSNVSLNQLVSGARVLLQYCQVACDSIKLIVGCGAGVGLGRGVGVGDGSAAVRVGVATAMVGRGVGDGVAAAQAVKTQSRKKQRLCFKIYLSYTYCLAMIV